MFLILQYYIRRKISIQFQTDLDINKDTDNKHSRSFFEEVKKGLNVDAYKIALSANQFEDERNLTNHRTSRPGSI